MLSAGERKKLFKAIRTVIADRYDEPKRRKVRPPLDQLMQSILWRYTGVKTGVRSFRKLKRYFVDWNEMRVSAVSETASVISRAGWAHDCAGHMRSILENLFHLRNVVNLDFLDDLTQSETTTFLRSLEGVGRDVADELLLFNYDANKLPLTHSGARMCFRMGLLEKDSTTLKNQRALMELWDQEYFVGFTLFLHDYSDSICKAKNPNHSRCPVEAHCPKTGLDE